MTNCFFQSLYLPFNLSKGFWSPFPITVLWGYCLVAWLGYLLYGCAGGFFRSLRVGGDPICNVVMKLSLERVYVFPMTVQPSFMEKIRTKQRIMKTSGPKALYWVPSPFSSGKKNTNYATLKSSLKSISENSLLSSIWSSRSNIMKKFVRWRKNVIPFWNTFIPPMLCFKCIPQKFMFWNLNLKSCVDGIWQSLGLDEGMWLELNGCTGGDLSEQLVLFTLWPTMQ